MLNSSASRPYRLYPSFLPLPAPRCQRKASWLAVSPPLHPCFVYISSQLRLRVRRTPGGHLVPRVAPRRWSRDTAGTVSARPFLKGGGGKSQLIPQLVTRSPPRNETFYEPFLGGG